MIEDDGEWDEGDGDGCDCEGCKALGLILGLSMAPLGASFDKRRIGPISMAVSCGKWPKGMPGCNLMMGMPSLEMPWSGMMDMTPNSFKARNFRSSRCSRLRRGTTYLSPSWGSLEGDGRRFVV